MNRKQLLLVLVALAIVGSAGLVLLKQHKESWNELGAKMGEKVMPNFHPNDVAAIRIKGDTELNLVHKNDGWRVVQRYDYPANFGKISDILIKLQGLKVVESETVNPNQLSRVNLDEPGSGAHSGILVEFKDAQGKILEALLLGKKHIPEKGEASHVIVAGEPDGRYILLRSDPRNVFLISDGLGGLDPNPEMWLSRDFIKVENIKSVSLTSPNPTNSWKVFHDTESSSWVLADAKPGESLAANKVYMLTNSLESPRFVDVAPAADAASAGVDQLTTVAIETFDNFSYTLKISPKGADDNYRVNVKVTANIPADKTKKLQEKLKQEQALAPWVYTVNSWILDSLLRERAQLLEGYKDPQPAETPKPTAAAQKEKLGWTPRVIQ